MIINTSNANKRRIIDIVRWLGDLIARQFSQGELDVVATALTILAAEFCVRLDVDPDTAKAYFALSYETVKKELRPSQSPAILLPMDPRVH